MVGIISQVLPGHFIRGSVEEWEEQFYCRGESINPLDDKLTNPLADELVKRVDEDWGISKYLEDFLEELDLMFGPEIELHSGAGIARHGTIDSNGVSLPASLTVRVKNHTRLESKLEYLRKRWLNQDLDVPYLMFDLVAARIVIGRTDRELYKRPLDKVAKFDPTSLVLNEVLRFMLRDKETLQWYNSTGGFDIKPDEYHYLGSPRDVKIVKEYSKRLSTLTKLLWQHGDIPEKLRERVLPEHLKEIVLCEKIFQTISSEKALDVFRMQNYSTDPKPNGYGTIHLVYSLNSGWVMPVYRELQIRTGFQHIFATHPNLAGHSAYLDGQNRQRSRKLIPDYSKPLADRMEQLVMLSGLQTKKTEIT